MSAMFPNKVLLSASSGSVPSNLDIKAVPLVLIHMNASQTGVTIGVKNLPTALIPSTIVLANPNI